MCAIPITHFLISNFQSGDFIRQFPIQSPIDLVSNFQSGNLALALTSSQVAMSHKIFYNTGGIYQ